jgi:DNA-nicking Smr family endonuclease
MSKRRLDPEERALWTDVTRSIKPLTRKRNVEKGDAAPAVPLPRVIAKTKPKPAILAPPPAPRPPRAEPASFGRKAKRRLARGGDAIHGRLDLHGMTQARAHDALLGFLRSSQAKGARVVLVITGKGADPYGERGVLKRQVPMWLRLPEFRDMVIGSETAAIGHGGEGALYVRLRRTRG